MPRARVRGALAWIDGELRCHAASGPGRYLYLVAGEALRFAGFGARRCEGCGVTVEPGEDGRALPACPLCGADLHG